VASDWLAATIEAQRPRLALWVPVLYALGIGAYFLVPAEPSRGALALLAAGLAIGFAALVPSGPAARTILLALLLPGLGFGAAALRSQMVAAPILAMETTANIEGRIIGLDRSASDRPRVLLDRVLIHGTDPSRTPLRVRISVDGSTPDEVLEPGLRILGQARLSPPAAPVEPGGFDFRRYAWFERIGAVGYARTPMLETEGSDFSGFHQLTFRLRMAFSAHIQERIPGQSGAFAAAILSGDRSQIDRTVEEALRVSNLYHIVSISGLHMTLLSAAIFALVRYGLALVPWLALNWPLKKVAAWAALIGGGAYLAISGFGVPTQRAYAMTACVLIAVLIDRPALTMRAVALAAMIVLVAAPESLVLAGFQMSFAATIALIATFEALRGRRWWQATQTERRWRYARPVIAAAMTSLAAGAATAPIAAFHFNATYQYGLLANLLATPAMGLVVMPGAVIAVLAMPFGLDWLPFQAVGLGMGYVIAVAEFVAALDGAVYGVRAGPPATLALIGLGGLFIVLWAGRGRWAGLAPIVLGLLLWTGDTRPDLLVADTGRLFGYRTEAGRILSSDRGNGFAADSWLGNDGDRASQAEAHARGGLQRRRHRIEAEAPGFGPVVYVGSKDETGAEADCAAAAVLIAPNWTRPPQGRCLFIGPERLAREGALAIWLEPEGLRVEGARTRNRARPWTRDPGAWD
jgi:competence protein ComEC